VLLNSVSSGRAQVTEITTAFAALRAEALWPVEGGVFDAMTSTFGPRIKASTGTHDWHRGIDLDAPEGTPVRAPIDGVFFGLRNYPDGGLTVILRHAFPTPVNYQGKSLSHYYTFYMHLSSVDLALQEAAAAGQTPAVPRGYHLGAVGHSGSALDDHLHWELRVGSPYSLEWQLQNPTSQYGYNQFGFDPHMHPMFLAVPYTAHGMGLTLLKKPGKTTGTVRFSSNDDQPLLNRILVQVKRRSDNRIMATHTLDLNQRTGYDATSTAALDTVNTTRPYLAPQPFGTLSPYVTDLMIPPTFVGSYTGTKYLTTVLVHDIWGRSTQIAW
jgi:murein DD-endopeptidase MepM/ murein hydrolase activator NlpD